ncbi:MAG: CinA family protein [Gammaproteobacteria bacterium]|nr:CinA family protein [Gammaproteobacteria bacterium]
MTPDSLTDSLYSTAASLGKLLKQHQLTIVAAESCTGGLVSAALTELPGSSAWFTQGWVTYTNNSKTQELGVMPELIVKYGAVSEQVAIAMAEGALEKSGADIAIATSGIAGPDGGSELKPVGTVWISVAIKDQKTFAECLFIKGNRGTIRRQTVVTSMQKTMQKVMQII